jgi:hypothetical protein
MRRVAGAPKSVATPEAPPEEIVADSVPGTAHVSCQSRVARHETVMVGDHTNPAPAIPIADRMRV